MIGRLVQSTDFSRALATAPRGRSTHFSIHFLAGRPTPAGPAPRFSEATKLSTGDQQLMHRLVDELSDALWLGAVVPKRHARRSVTRALLKRQIRHAVQRQAPALARGVWVVRLRAPFDAKQFTSAASDGLRRAARVELDAVLSRCHAAR